MIIHLKFLQLVPSNSGRLDPHSFFPLVIASCLSQVHDPDVRIRHLLDGVVVDVSCRMGVVGARLRFFSSAVALISIPPCILEVFAV